MGSKVSKIPGVKNVSKVINKVVPKALRPYVPYAAAFIPGGNFFAGTLAKYGANAALKAAVARGLVDPDASFKDVLKTGAMAAAPQAIGQGLGSFGQKFGSTAMSPNAMGGSGGADLSILEKVGDAATKASFSNYTNPEFTSGKLIDTAKVAGTLGSVDAAQQFAKLNEEELAKYNANLLAQGIGDKTARRSAIFQIFQNAGYDDDEVNSMLDVYKYADGGRAGFNKRGLVNEPGGYAGTGGGRGGGTGTYNQFYNSKKPKKGIETIQIGEEEDDGDKKISIKDFITAMQGDDSIEDGLDYAQQGLSMLNQGGAKPTPMMRLGLEEGGSSNKEGILSITDGDEEGPSGVMYSDEKGNPITKEEAMKLFNKQAEKENKSKKKKKSKKNNIESELREETPNAYPFMMGTSPITHLRRYLKNNKANGGVIGLMNGGNPAMEMDYRQGGFIPVGAKERADDVPARLSKNEFVMTADAVRAAGGGSVNQGAKRMYELMNNLEAKV